MEPQRAHNKPPPPAGVMQNMRKFSIIVKIRKYLGRDFIGVVDMLGLF